MRRIIKRGTAAVMASAAAAQMTPTAALTTPSASERTMESTELTNHTPLGADSGMAGAPARTERDHRWWPGDREATTAEITADKTSKKARRPG